MTPADLPQFTQLQTTRIQQRQTVPLALAPERVRQELAAMFDDVRLEMTGGGGGRGEAKSDVDLKEGDKEGDDMEGDKEGDTKPGAAGDGSTVITVCGGDEAADGVTITYTSES